MCGKAAQHMRVKCCKGEAFENTNIASEKHKKCVIISQRTCAHHIIRAVYKAWGEGGWLYNTTLDTAPSTYRKQTPACA